MRAAALAALAAALLLRPAATARPCLDKDWRFGFAACAEAEVDLGRTRGVFAYVLPEVCDAHHVGSRPAPAPKLGLPCHIPCPAGSKLAVDLLHPDGGNDNAPAEMKVTCRQCEAGTFSLGGGRLIDGAAGDWARGWPPDLGAFCFYRGTDYQWHPGTGGALLCTLHLGGNLATETRPGTWNEHLRDEDLKLPIEVMTGDRLACQPIKDTATFNGKAVLVERGTCTFQTKTTHLFAAGAKAVIVHNDLPHRGFFYPAPSNASDPPKIPIFMITKEDGDKWSAEITRIKEEDGEELRLLVPSTRCSAAAKEYRPLNEEGVEDHTAGENNTEAFLAREGWDTIGDKKGCAPWKVDPSGRFLHSGSNLHFHWMSSVLTMSVRFVRDGHVRFRYAVDAEGSSPSSCLDGLNFYVDQVQRLNRTCMQQAWKEFRLDVSRGEHTFTWFYSKDYSSSKGEDRAKLQMIEVVGSAYSDTECRPCHGTSESGTDLCSECGRDEYIELVPATEGHPESQKCLVCPPGKWAAPGAVGVASCEQRRPCLERDSEIEYHAFEVLANGSRQILEGHCLRHESLVQYKWRQPLLCDPSAKDSYQLPRETEVVRGCPPCQPNQQRTKDGGPCVPATKECPSGSYALRELVVKHWEVWPQNFSREVWGHTRSLGSDVFGRGWRLNPHGAFAATGSAFGAMSPELDMHPSTAAEMALLHLDVSLPNAGNLTTFLETEPMGMWGRLATLSVNGTPAKDMVVEGRLTPGPVRVGVPLPAGQHRITWTWHFDRAGLADTGGLDETPTGIKVFSVSVTHALGAGSASCHQCAEGQEVAQDLQSCWPCPAGQSTQPCDVANDKDCRWPKEGVFWEPGTGCHECPEGRVSSAGDPWCRSCGPGLLPSEDGDACKPVVFLDGGGEETGRRWIPERLGHAWHGFGPAGNRTALPFKVEDRRFYLSLFAKSANPLGDGEGDGELAYLWEWLPPRSSESHAKPIAGGICDTDGAHFRSAGAYLESIVPAEQGPVGVWATFAGPCEHQTGDSFLRRVRIFFRCDAAAWQDDSDVRSAARAIIRSGSRTGFTFVEGHRPAPDSCEDVAIEWKTFAGCPVCRKQDYVPVKSGACDPEVGQTMVWVPASPCSGGEDAPPTYEEDCGGGEDDPVFTHGRIELVFGFAATALAGVAGYVLLLRRRYSKYMQLDTDGVAPTSIGAADASL